MYDFRSDIVLYKVTWRITFPTKVYLVVRQNVSWLFPILSVQGTGRELAPHLLSLSLTPNVNITYNVCNYPVLFDLMWIEWMDGAKNLFDVTFYQTCIHMYMLNCTPTIFHPMQEMLPFSFWKPNKKQAWLFLKLIIFLIQMTHWRNKDKINNN